MKGSEFLRKIRKIAKAKGLAYKWDPSRGEGSHGTAYLGERFTVVKEIQPGLLSDMLKQLGLSKEDL